MANYHTHLHYLSFTQSQREEPSGKDMEFKSNTNVLAQPVYGQNEYRYPF